MDDKSTGVTGDAEAALAETEGSERHIWKTWDPSILLARIKAAALMRAICGAVIGTDFGGSAGADASVI